MPDVLDWLITNSPILVLVCVTIWYAYSTHKLVKQNTILLIIDQIYAPLNTIVISVQRLINTYEEANLTPVQNIKEKIWYNLVGKSMSRAIKEWQDKAKKYKETRRV